MKVEEIYNKLEKDYNKKLTKDVSELSNAHIPDGIMEKFKLENLRLFVFENNAHTIDELAKLRAENVALWKEMNTYKRQVGPSYLDVEEYYEDNEKEEVEEEKEQNEQDEPNYVDTVYTINGEALGKSVEKIREDLLDELEMACNNFIANRSVMVAKIDIELDSSTSQTIKCLNQTVDDWKGITEKAMNEPEEK